MNTLRNFVKPFCSYFLETIYINGIFGSRVLMTYNVPHWECTSSPGMGMCLTLNTHLHREWGCASLGMHILIGNGDVPHREWGRASPGIHILTGNGDVPHFEYTSPQGMEMCLTGNAHPHQECISSLGMHIVYTG